VQTGRVGVKFVAEDKMEVVVVEVKNNLDGWKEGLGQAALYESITDYAYLAIPTYPWHFAREENEFLRGIVFPARKKLGFGLARS